jgi:shikimate dehydrogenase
MKVFCILSDERADQLKSPAIFTRVLRRQGIKGTYVPFKVKPQDLGKAIQSLRILNIAGANITVPYKEATIPFLDVLSEGANIIGAVNTVVRDGERLKGYNTNAIGIMDALDEADFEVEGCRALVFGTGGAARAVVFILNWLRASRIYLVGRSPQKARAISTTFSGEVLEMSSLPGRSLSADILINATAVSSREESPEMEETVRQLAVTDCRLVFDLNYGRRENFWQEMAQRKGVSFMDGLKALAYQARRTFALWTGMQVPPGEFITALTENRRHAALSD